MSSYFPQVGDFVMIRPWDDMVKEFGTNSYGDISTLPIAILNSMKQYCGHFYTVESVTITAVGSWCSFADVNYDFPVCSLVLPVFESSLTFDDLLKGAS
jgi:hypothetical protein